jgi:hypothetical protein
VNIPTVVELSSWSALFQLNEMPSEKRLSLPSFSDLFNHFLKKI